MGIGNTLLKDEGLGVYAIRYLSESFNFTSNSMGVDFIDGATLGLNLLNIFYEYDKVLIIDTISVDEEVGSYFKIPYEKLLDSAKTIKSVHEIDIIDTLSTAKLLLDSLDVTFYSIVPKEICSVEFAISSEIEKPFSKMLDFIAKEIEEIGFVKTKKRDVTLDEIVKSL